MWYKQLLARMWGQKNTFTLLMEMQISITTMKSNMEVSQKLKIGLPFNSEILLLGI
jgi:hypothetical protein